MREITDHIVECDKPDRPFRQLEVLVLDEPGNGGANHLYYVQARGGRELFSQVKFQNGPIGEGDWPNGVTHEALLAIVIDRLRSFQAGRYSCRENAIALTHIEEALMWLQRRTRERIKRGVEGKSAL